MAGAAGRLSELLRNRAPGPGQRHIPSPPPLYPLSFPVPDRGNIQREMPERLRLCPAKQGIAATAPPPWGALARLERGRWRRRPIRWLASAEPPPLCRWPPPSREDSRAGGNRTRD